jgi:hypothetical protein
MPFVSAIPDFNSILDRPLLTSEHGRSFALCNKTAGTPVILLCSSQLA